MLASALALVFGALTLPAASLPSAASSFAPHSVLLSLRSSHTDVQPRQLLPTVSLGGAPIPLACEGRCESSVPVFNACTSGTDVEGCLGVCKILDPFVQCCNCLLVNDQGQGPAATGAQFRAAENQLDAIIRVCVARDLGEAPQTTLLPFDQIGANVTGTASASLADPTSTTTGADAQSTEPAPSQTAGNTGGADRSSSVGSSSVMMLVAAAVALVL